MKTNSITTPNYSRMRGHECPSDTRRESAYERHNLKQDNNDKINTTIKSNSDGRASFGHRPALHVAAEKAMDNPILAEAIFALVITCGLRPLAIMGMARSEDAKDKSKYQVGKSISTGVVGLAMSALVMSPLSGAIKNLKDTGKLKITPELAEKSKETVNKGVKALTGYLDEIVKSEGVEESFIGQIKDLTKNNKINLDIFKGIGKDAEKQFGKKLAKRAPEVFKQYSEAATAQRVLNNYSNTAKNVLDKMLQPVFMPFRATVTIALIPIIMNALGIKKGGSKPKENETQPKAQQEIKQAETSNQKLEQSQVVYSSLKQNMFQGNKDKELFNHFSGVAKYENK